MDNLVIRDFGSVEVFRSDADGRWVVQIDTEPDGADGGPEIRVFVNGGLVFESPPPESHAGRISRATPEQARPMDIRPPARARLQRQVYTRFWPPYAGDWGVSPSQYYRVIGASHTGASRYVEMMGDVKVVPAVCLTYPGRSDRD